MTETSTTTRAVPWLLIVLALLLVADVIAVLVRWIARRRARSVSAGAAGSEGGAGQPDRPSSSGDAPGDVAAPGPLDEPVGVPT